MIPSKWQHNPAKNVIYSRAKVTNADVEEIVDWAIDNVESINYRVWSGVHGLPGGMIQLPEEEFFEVDRRDLSTKLDHYKVTVHKMDVVTTPPQKMLKHLSEIGTTTILAWCYSEGFLVF